MADLPSLSFERSIFLEGPVNAGKTTAAASSMRQTLLENGDDPQRILIIVPQVPFGASYLDAIRLPDMDSSPTIITHSAFARRALRLFWPQVSGAISLAPDHEPVFLNFETAQYYMSQFAAPLINTGVFDGLSLPPNRLIAQLLDNINKAFLAGFTIDEAEHRLKRAWGLRLGTSRETVYHVAAQIARNYYQFCLQHGLLDFAAQIKLFNDHLLASTDFKTYFSQTFSYLIADNIEEMGALTHDFVNWCLQRVNKSILIYDTDGGYRVFLGADPINAHSLSQTCETRFVLNAQLGLSSQIQSLVQIIQGIFGDENEEALTGHARDIDQCFHILRSSYYPDMLYQCGSAIRELIGNKGVPASQIAVVTPYISDSLRFTLTNIFAELGIDCEIIRPSRPLIAEPAIRVLIPLMALVYSEYLPAPSPDDLAIALSTLISDLDPIRANLLVQIVYHGNLSSWSGIKSVIRERITESAGQRYEFLREWLAKAAIDRLPLDLFLANLFDNVLSQPGYGFHNDPDAYRAVDNLIQSVHNFREKVNLVNVENRPDATRDVLELIINGLITARYDDEMDAQDGVLISPAHTYLTRNKIVDYQFWLDIGHDGWSKRLEQPLTHPFVLRRGYLSDHVWSDEDEEAADTQMLRNVTLGLLRRCRKGLYVGFCDLNEMGYEQYGPLVNVFQQLLSIEGLD